MGLATNFRLKYFEAFNPLQMDTHHHIKWINNNLVPKLSKAKVKHTELMTLENFKGDIVIEVKKDSASAVLKAFIDAGIKDARIDKGSKDWTSKVIGKFPK